MSERIIKDRRASATMESEPVDISKVEVRKDGSVRRIAPGYRSASDFFSEEGQRREVTRGELLNVLGMIEYNTRESKWYRRLWRWYKGVPQVVDIRTRLYDAHEGTIADAKRILEAEAEGIREKLSQAKGKESKQGEAK